MTEHEYFNADGHLTDFALYELVQGEPDELTRLELAEHLSFCDECTERYAELLCGDALLSPPEPLVPGVLQRIRQQARTIFLNRYLSAGLAACLALVFWVTGVFSSLPLRNEGERLRELSSYSQRFSEGTADLGRGITDQINRFFDQLKGGT